MYNLTPADLEIQERARSFVDELIPYEEEAEANRGELPRDVEARFRARALELGLHATNMPREYGGGGYSCSSRCSSRSRGAGPPTRSAGCSARRRPGSRRWPRPSRSRST